MAALRAFDSITRREADQKVTSLYLDIGAGSTKVVVAHGRDMVFARSIELGGRHLGAAVARQLEVELSRSAGAPAGDGGGRRGEEHGAGAGGGGGEWVG